jgi:hypothetical protein
VLILSLLISVLFVHLTEQSLCFLILIREVLLLSFKLGNAEL